MRKQAWMRIHSRDEGCTPLLTFCILPKSAPAALAEFCSKAAEKLRKQHSATGCITVFIRTNPFNRQDPQYQPSASVKLDAATQQSRAIVAAKRLLKEIVKAGYGYHKYGVQLSRIQPESSPGQLELFDFADNGLPAESRRLMKAIEQINRRFPKAISVAATGFDKTRKSRTERISQSYTTSWNELAWVK